MKKESRSSAKSEDGEKGLDGFEKEGENVIAFLENEIVNELCKYNMIAGQYKTSA